MTEFERPIEAETMRPPDDIVVPPDPRGAPPLLRLALLLVGVPLLGLALLLAWPPAPAGNAGAVGGWLLGVAGALLAGAGLRGRRPGWLGATEPVVWPDAVGSAALGLLFAARREIAPAVGARTGLSAGAAQWLVGAAALAILAGIIARRAAVAGAAAARARERVGAPPPEA